jgi:hypothetical protein
MCSVDVAIKVLRDVWGDVWTMAALPRANPGKTWTLEEPGVQKMSSMETHGVNPLKPSNPFSLSTQF